MTDVTLTLTGKECAALFAAVTNERDALLSDLENGDIPKADIIAAHSSIKTCDSLLAKLSDASPDTTYTFCE